jgi:cytochrome bd ubiquinol oxidase subunit II
MFSGFYLPLLLILVALILRGVAFEYRGKRDEPEWKARWDRAIFWGSLVPAVLWGVAFGNLVRGVPMGADHEYAGDLLDLLNPYALLGGLTTLALFVTHGAVFLALKTRGDIRERANALAGRVGVGAAVVAIGFSSWTVASYADGAESAVLAAVAAVALVGGLTANRFRREGWAFVGSAFAIGLAVIGWFAGLFPEVMPSSTSDAYSLTVHNASSTPYTLEIMTWAGAFCTPVVIGYQAWSYWVFRRRIGVESIPPSAPADSAGQR